MISSPLTPTSLVIGAGPFPARTLISNKSTLRLANMKPSEPVIIVHGGAGDWPSEVHKQGLNGVRVAADRGFRVLSRGGSALDAVQAAVVVMEDNTVFNAGRGS